MSQLKQRIQTAAALVCCATLAAAQEPAVQAPPSGPLTVRAAIEFATRNYPAIRASLAETSAAESGVDLAKTAYLPQADLYYQMNLASRNNIFGLLFPNSMIPPISGPALAETTGTGTFGTAAGLMVAWEPFDFGLRKANVGVARALRDQANAGIAVTEFDVATTVVDAFFQALAAQQVVKAAQANVDRVQVFVEAVGALVASQLRPGADDSRARAELARARTELIVAERNEREARLTLARWLGLGGQDIQIDSGRLLEEPPGDEAAVADLKRHPLAAAQTAGIEVVRARQKSLAKEYRPKFEVLSAVYGRGSGANLDGSFQGGANGLAPSVGNWAVGLGVEFPIFDYKSNRVRRSIEAHHEQAETARLDEVLEQLKSEVGKAKAQVEAARRIAENTPVQLAAARTLETQASARYQAGLGTVVEMAEAQRLLRQAETDDALARLGIWRSLFAVAAAEGDMTALLAASSN